MSELPSGVGPERPQPLPQTNGEALNARTGRGSKRPTGPAAPVESPVVEPPIQPDRALAAIGEESSRSSEEDPELITVLEDMRRNRVESAPAVPSAEVSPAPEATTTAELPTNGETTRRKQAKRQSKGRGGAKPAGSDIPSFEEAAASLGEGTVTPQPADGGEAGTIEAAAVDETPAPPTGEPPVPTEAPRTKWAERLLREIENRNPFKRPPSQPTQAPQVNAEEEGSTTTLSEQSPTGDETIPEPGGPEEATAAAEEIPAAAQTEESAGELTGAREDQDTGGEITAPPTEEPTAINEATREPVPSPLERSRRERIIETIAQRLENTRVFGKPLPELAFRGIGLGGIRWGAKELAKGIVSWSGLAGAVGGGVTGTVVAGGFVGAVAGAAVEYIRQVDANLSARVKESSPDLTSRKAIFLQKLKESSRTREVFTQVDKGKLGRAALFGAITGAGAGALMEVVGVNDPLGVKKFLSENAKGFIPNLGGLGEAATEAVKNVGAAGAVASQSIGQIPGAEQLGEAAGAVGKKVGDITGGIGQAIGEKAGEIGRWANIGGAVDASQEATQQAAASAAEAAKAQAENVISQADFDALKSQLEDQRIAYNALKTQFDTLQQTVRAPSLTEYVPRADFDNIQQQLADAKSALAAGGVLSPADQAAAATKAAAEQAAARAAEAAQNQVTEAFTNLHLDENYALQSGDSVAGITEKLGRSLGLNNQQAWELGRKLAEENGITSQYYGTTGTVLDRQLPVGKVMNMQGVKTLASEFLKKKVA